MPLSIPLRCRSLVLLPLALALGGVLSLVAASLGVPSVFAQEGASLEVHVAACPAGYTGSAIFEDCHGAGVADVEVAIATADGGVSQEARTVLPATPGPGVATFSGLPAGTFSLALGLDPAAGRYATFCTDANSDSDIDALVTLDPGDEPTGTITLADGQAVVCDIYLIPPPGLEATDLLAALTTLTLPEIATDDLSADPTDGEASVTVTPLICPPGTEAPNGYADLAGICTAPISGVDFTWAAEGSALSTHDSDDGTFVIDGIAPGSYTLASGIPLEFAREALFCIADGGDRYQKTFDERGVTMFQNIQREEIACQWFVMPFALAGDLAGGGSTEAPAATTAPTTAPVVTPTPEPTAVAPTPTPTPTPLPETARGVETGASLEIHLGLCPPGYTGDALFATCHDVGVSDQTYSLTGPNGVVEAVTTVPSSPGPGVVVFTGLPAGDYRLTGGPPGDFGTIRLYCTSQPDGAAVDATTQGGIASLALGDGQDVLCDWYFIPVNQGGPSETATASPTPTTMPAPSDISVMLLACPVGTEPAAASGDLQAACGAPVEGIAFALTGAGAPIDTVSGADGGLRFDDLPPGDYTLRASLPSDVASATVQCRLNDGDLYRKALADGGTTFVNVDGDVVTCAWFLIPVDTDPDPSTPSGAITIREFICDGDAAEITDWDAQCAPGASGSVYTIRPYVMSFERTAQPDGDGVVTIAGLPDGLYTVLQDGGMWCRARAERVDSQSRVIVEGGRNTDLHLYQCDDVVALPNTGAGPGAGATGSEDAAPISPMAVPGAWWQAVTLPEMLALGAGLIGAGILIGWTRTRVSMPQRMNRRAVLNVE